MTIDPAKVVRDFGLPLDNREVGAMITYRVMPKKDPHTTDELIDRSSISEIFGLNAGSEDNPGSLIVRRPWYGFDRSSYFDEELFDLSDTSIRQDDSLTRFGKLLNLGHDFKAVSSAFERAQEDLPNLIAEGGVNQIHLRFKDGEDPEKKIQAMVPLDKLRKSLMRFGRSLEKTARGSIEEIRIIDAPRFNDSRLSAPVDWLMDMR